MHYKSPGFTLIEVLTVIGMISILALFSLFVGVDSYRGYSFRGEQDLILSLLQKARSEAQTNICLGTACSGGVAHGVHFDTSAHTYTIFQGATFAARDTTQDEVIKANYNLDFTGSTLTDVIFQPLSGNSVGGQIKLTDPTSKHTDTMVINAEGQITW